MSDLDEGIKSRIEKEITSNEVVLFMKGTPVFPQCGFSSMVSHNDPSLLLFLRCPTQQFSLTFLSSGLVPTLRNTPFSWHFGMPDFINAIEQLSAALFVEHTTPILLDFSMVYLSVSLHLLVRVGTFLVS